MSQHPSELQRLIDRAAIHDLLACYFRGIDAADRESVRGCFTDDVRAAYEGRDAVDGIDALMRSFLTFNYDFRTLMHAALLQSDPQLRRKLPKVLGDAGPGGSFWMIRN